MDSKHRKRLSLIVLLLVLLVVGFCVQRSAADKGIALPIISDYIDSSEPSLPSADEIQNSAERILDSAYEKVEEFLFGTAPNGTAGSSPSTNGFSAPVDGAVQVHIQDMGQADSILILAPDATVLIDAGENDQGDQVLRYLAAQGITSIDLLIATHPHSDHIGGMDTVINGIEVGRILMPALPDALIPTTKTYTDLLIAIDRNDVHLQIAEPGQTFDLGDGALLTILGPQGSPRNLNDLSIVSRLDYGTVSFLFTGDIESAAEAALLASGVPLQATILDVPHHGSRTSSTPEFIGAVAPALATISCGLDNSYGHPHRETLEILAEAAAHIARTDRSSHLVIVTDGKEFSFSTAR